MASFKEPNSEVYFLTVPFSSDYKNIIDFSSATAQYNAFMDIAGKKHFTKLNIIRPTDNVLYIKEDFGEYYKYNYIMFRNPLLSNKWFYAFITDAFYNAENVTEIHYILDVWQTFQFDITYYRCMIERGIVPRSKDNYKDWLQNEPLSVKPYEMSNDKNTAYPNWSPKFCVEALSYPAEIKNVYYDGLWLATVEEGLFSNKYTYGGTGFDQLTPDESTAPFFMLDLTAYDTGDHNKWYELYTRYLEKYGDIVDHRTDVLHIRVLPRWVYDNIQFVRVDGLSGTPPFARTNNPISTQVVNANIDNTKLTAINYTPRNKKMLSSLARSFYMYNENLTVSKQFLPEYVLNDRIVVTATTKPIGMSNIKLETDSYQLKNESILFMPYDLIFNSAYNSNVGVQKAIKVTNAGIDVAQGVAHIAESIYGLQGANLAVDFARIRRQPSNLRSAQWELYKQKDLAFERAGREEHGLYLLNSVQDTFNAGVSLAQSLTAQTGGQSILPDFNVYTALNCMINLKEVNPNLEDCKAIDTFLDTYGYAINETDLISNWTNTRSNWNYVKTQGANLKVKASDAIENAIKTIFDNGTTIWHSFSAFGRYNNKNVTNGTTINL